MQRINEAYRKGDIATLIEMETQYASLEMLPEVDETGLAEFLQKQIDTLTREIELLHSQLDRTTAELANINRSDIGKLYKQSKRKFNPADEITAGMDETINHLTLLRDSLKEYMETGVAPPALVAELEPDEPAYINVDDLIEAFLEMEEKELRKGHKGRRRR
jgi:hypothetical protein